MQQCGAANGCSLAEIRKRHGTKAQNAEQLLGFQKVRTLLMRNPGKVIVACMRNEALFVVEWVAHHLALGFDRIVVYTNDCQDGTDRLLDAMAGLMPVEHYDNPGPYEAGTIQKQALALAYALPQVRQAEWVLHIDADEYVNVTLGSRRIDDLIALYPDVDGITLQWRHFGGAGMARWEGGSVIETYTRCERDVPVPGSGAAIGFKTLFRPEHFRMMGVHQPKLVYKRRVPRIVNSAGVAMPVDALLSRRKSNFLVEPAQCSWENACLHHHHVKSDDLHLLKHARGDANGRKNSKRLIGSDYYSMANRNEVESKSLLRFRPQVTPYETQIRGLPGVMALEAAALVWFRQRFHDAVELSGQAEQEEAALDWIAARMTALRHSSGPERFEADAVAWFKNTLASLQSRQTAEIEDGADAVTTPRRAAG